MDAFDLQQHRQALVEYFVSRREVVLAYLYGSQARGNAGPLSDVDFAVLLAGRPAESVCFDVRLEITGDLMALLKTNDVDVAVMNCVPVSLRYRVLRDGELLFCRDRDSMIAFRLHTVNEYLDFKPILDRHESAILERARKGELFDGYNPHRGALGHYRQLRERLESAAESDI
jgi:predicted nucleotidyltransferase